MGKISQTTLLVCLCGALCAQQNDAGIFEDCIKKCRENSASHSAGEIAQQAARFFVAQGVPYTAHTLETSDVETLTVNLKEMDCTTFVETCIAIAKTVASGNTTYRNYTDTLTALRYRYGQIDGYASRLHYTSDWIYENRSRLTDMSPAMGGQKATAQINFMSTHPQSYRHLKNNPENVEKIKTVEDAINRRNASPPPTARSIVPTDRIAACEQTVRDGDIIAFATSIPGLDYSHLGIACRHNGKLHFIHASSKGKRVMFEPRTLLDYCQNTKTCTGISILRIKESNE